MPQLSAQDQARCIEFLKALVRTPSLSGQEGQLASLVAQEMRDVGFDEVYTDKVGNVIGRLGQRGGPRLLFNAHMDTVGVGNPAAWRYDPYGATVDEAEGLLYGRGAVDMKGALAAMVYSARGLREHLKSLKGELILAAVVHEEPCEGMAMRALAEEEGLWPGFVVLGEPTNLQLAVGHRGRVELRVVAEGRACHSANPELGVNALHAAAKIIFGIELLSQQLPEDPDLGRGSIAVTGLICPVDNRNTVPDRCELIIDRRLTLGETRDRALAEIRQIIEREGVKATVSVAEFEHTTYTGYVGRGQEYYPPWLMPEDAPLVKMAAKALERALGARPRLKIWAFSTDGAYTRGVAGIPTVGFGPGDERLAHTADEHVRLADVLSAAAGYAEIALEVLGRR